MNKYRTIFALLTLMSSSIGIKAQNPGGVKSPVVWFKTIAKDSVNGSYHWSDTIAGSTLYVSESTNEVTAKRTTIHTYNFNPALPFDSTTNQEFTVNGSALDQKTVIGVVGAKRSESDRDAFLYRIKSNHNRMLSKTKVYHITADGNTSYTYNPNIISPSDTAKRVKIVSYLEALQPDHSVWGRNQWAKVSFGGAFSRATEEDTLPAGEHIASGNFYSPELVVYPRYLSGEERLKVETYLALKYGITLEDKYLSPSGMELWRKGGTYSNRITGFGKDVRSGFNQLMSTTSYEENAYDVDDTYHLCNSNNKSSAYNLLVMGFMDDTSLPDSCYVLFADNNKETSILTDEETPDSLYTSDSLKLMQRHWELKTVGLDSTYRFQVELGYNMTKDSIFALYRNQNIYLVFNNHGEDKFDNTDELDTIRMTEVDEERQKVIFSDVKLKPSCYFTFGFKGVPMEKPDPEVFDYYLELTDPNCDGNQDLSDGKVKLLLPESENGFAYTFGGAEQGGMNYEIAYDSIVLDNLSHGNYRLSLIPQGANSIQFNGNGVTLVNVHFINNSGTAEWVVEDVQTESKVAFVNQSVNTANEANLLYGVKFAGGKLYKIENGNVSAEEICDVDSGDRILLERTNQTNISIFKNAVSIINMTISPGSTFKLGVKSQFSNVSQMVLGNFDWGTSDFPYFFLDQYRAANVFTYEHSETQSAGPTGFMNYHIDFSDYCYNQGGSNAGQDNLTISTDQQYKQITATYTSNENCDVTISLYDENGRLYSSIQGAVRNGRMSGSFSVNKPGVYFVVVNGCNNSYRSEGTLIY